MVVLQGVTKWPISDKKMAHVLVSYQILAYRFEPWFTGLFFYIGAWVTFKKSEKKMMIDNVVNGEEQNFPLPPNIGTEWGFSPKSSVSSLDVESEEISEQGWVEESTCVHIR